MSGGDRDDDERPRLSWSEIDKRRDRPGQREPERRPRGPVAEAQSRAASQRYLKTLDQGVFAGDAAGSQGDALARAVRDAHGTPELAAACRSFRDAIGMPEDTSLLPLFLDARDPELQVAALAQLLALSKDGRLSVTQGLKSQLRLLSEDANDDVACAAEDLLESL